jgi:DNA ligase D-like protein (predicted ligase)
MQSYKPMLAKNFLKPFSHRDWLFEVKWDGFRAIAYVKKEFSLKSRNDNELKNNFPEISELKQLSKDIVVDGELIVMKHGVPDFQAMQERAKATNQRSIERLAIESPATYVIFDILEKDGQDLTSLPLIDRKQILRSAVKESKNICLVDSIDKQGEEYYKIVAANGLEGVVAKKKDSTYEQGKRSDSWLKIKQLQSCDCVIFGYTDGDGSRAATFGALVVGLYDEARKPVYVCNVSSGLSGKTLEILSDFFEKTKVEKRGHTTSVKPLLVCEVVYQTVTRDYSLRAPRFKGIRIDKKPSECTLKQINPS